MSIEGRDTMESNGRQPTQEELDKAAKDESDRLTVDFGCYKQSEDNVFHKLFFKKRNPDNPDAPLIVRKATAANIGDNTTWFRAYNLTPEEVETFLGYYNVPVLSVQNIKSDDIPDWNEDSRITLYHEALSPNSKKGALSVMWTRDYDFVCKEVFELQTFPYDYQDLSIDLNIEGTLPFDFQVNDIRFFRQSLQTAEWDVLEPNVLWLRPTASQIHLRVRRQSWYYIQNVVFMMAMFTYLGLITFAADITDLGTRTSNLFTLILTAVAFKFILASSLPKISYNTLLDYYVLICMVTLALMLVGVIIPFQVSGYHLGNDDNDEVAKHVNTYLLYGFASFITLSLFGWIAIAKISAYLAFRSNMSKYIPFDPTKDPDHCYDFSITYTEQQTDLMYLRKGSPSPKGEMLIQAVKQKKHKSPHGGLEKKSSFFSRGTGDRADESLLMKT